MSLNFLFRGTVVLLCPDAADANDDGRVDISDPIWVITYLFLGDDPPPPPFPEPDQDPTDDSLEECEF